MKNFNPLLYAVTDRSWLNGRLLYDDVERALQGGVTMLQLREKNLTENEFYKEALEIKSLCKKYNVPFIINDDVALAKKVDADGVHIGQNDMSCNDARKILGCEKIIGVSVQNTFQALEAQNSGADYLGVGAVFKTSSKDDADSVSLEECKKICVAVKIPVVAIGGICCENLEQLSNLALSGISVISAIFAKDDIMDAAKNLRKKLDEGILK